MTKNQVTIAIPTFNRRSFLKDCLASVLAQEGVNFQVIVIDNSSSDETAALVESLADSRLSYLRNALDLGWFGNWCRAVAVNSSDYLTILPDDDRLLPNFLAKSIKVLEENPHAAFSATLASYINAEGVYQQQQEAENMPNATVSGLDYLHHLVNDSAWTIHPATVVMRSSALADVGGLQVSHTKQLSELNLYIRLAARFDIAFIYQELAQVRQHSGQVKAQEFRVLEGTQELAELAEKTDALAYLLHSKRAEDKAYRSWLSQQLLSLNQHRSQLTRCFFPTLNLSSLEQKKIREQKIADVIPEDKATLILVNDDRSSLSIPTFKQLPFLEREGMYNGLPADDETAIAELERLRRVGASFIVFWETARWWLDYYSQFSHYLHREFSCIYEDENSVIFDLRKSAL